jgi:hypothetical protein
MLENKVVNKQHLRRPRIQRAFEHWFKNNNTRFAVPVFVTKISGKGIELRFQNYPDCLSVWLGLFSLSVHVNWQGHWWDMLMDLDASIITTHDGYKCELCLFQHGNSAKIFPSKEALWQDHLFEPFLQWVNEDLAPARWLQISGFASGSTSARLIRNNNDLKKPDPGVILIQNLVSLDRTTARERNPDGMTEWLVELRPEAK